MTPPQRPSIISKPTSRYHIYNPQTLIILGKKKAIWCYREFWCHKRLTQFPNFWHPWAIVSKIFQHFQNILITVQPTKILGHYIIDLYTIQSSNLYGKKKRDLPCPLHSWEISLQNLRCAKTTTWVLVQFTFITKWNHTPICFWEYNLSNTKLD